MAEVDNVIANNSSKSSIDWNSLKNSLTNSGLGGLMGFGLDFGSGIISSIFRNYNLKQDLKAKKEYFDYTADRNLADTRTLRDEDRAYNDPAAQSERMYRAGMNPYSGNGSTALSDVTPSDSTLTPGETAGFSSPGLNSVSDPLMLAQAELASAQAAKIRAETPASGEYSANLNSKTAENLAAADNLVSQKDLNAFKLSMETELRETNISLAKQNYENAVKYGEVLLSQAAQNNASAEQLRDLIKSQAQDRLQMQAHIALMELQGQVASAEAAKLKAELPKIEAEIAEIFSRELLNNEKAFSEFDLRALYRARTGESESRADLNEAERNNVNSRTRRNDLEIEFLPYLLGSEILKNCSDSISELLDTYFDHVDRKEANQNSRDNTRDNNRARLGSQFLSILFQYYMMKK